MATGRPTSTRPKAPSLLDSVKTLHDKLCRNEEVVAIIASKIGLPPADGSCASSDEENLISQIDHCVGRASRIGERLAEIADRF